MRFALSILIALTVNIASIHYALAKGIFAMYETNAALYMPLVNSILTRSNLPSSALAELPLLKAKSVSMLSGKEVIHASSGEATFSTADAKSIAVISISGPIMKYDTCDSVGSITIGEAILSALANPNIAGIVLDMDTPGGELSGTKNLSDIIANAKKPVVAHVNDGMCASAGMYIACSADRILATQETDRLGSIGVYSTLIDPTGAYLKEGYTVKNVYSPLSPQKNIEFRQAIEENNLTLKEAELRFIDNVFMNTVKSHRGDKLNPTALEGGLFFAQEAIEMGICDGFATQQQAIEQCFNLSQSNQLIKFQ